MQVRTNVSDSKINRIQVGDTCLVRVDTDPENPVNGIVRRMSSFPLPRRWYQAPIEYEVFVEIVQQSSLIRPGLRAKVEIFTERIDNVLQCPLSSVVRQDDDYYVFVMTASGIEARKVELGTNNEQFVIITAGLEAGQDVLVDGDGYKADYKFPAIP
jgi:multidrug efflux pump subunit AcrA (membrane-fusion protein)